MSFEINGEPVLANVQTYSTDFEVGDAIYAAANETADRPNYETTRSSTLTDGELALDVLRMTSGAYLKFVVFQGETSGYTSGGNAEPNIPVTTIDKFPFTSDIDATTVGDLILLNASTAGQSSTTSGYSSRSVIEKFPFSASFSITEVGNLSETRAFGAGQSSVENGYTSGGSTPIILFNVVDKFPFATDTNASDVGDLTQGRYGAAGQSSSESGYSSGGVYSKSPALFNTVIDKFPFSSDTNASEVGFLDTARYHSAGQSSASSGYTSGGLAPITNIIDKFPFATDTNATDVGVLSQIRYGAAGQSSVENGYTSGGASPTPTLVRVDTVDKFPFATDTNATNVGDLTQARYLVAGQQV